MHLNRSPKRLRSPEERVGTLSHASLPPPPAATLDLEEHLWVQALRKRDESAFERLVERYYSPMLRLALSFVRSRDEAEEVVQETWLGVLTGLERFEGRSSLKTWIFRILVNRARSRAKREARTLPFSALAGLTRASAQGPEAADGMDLLDRLGQNRPGLGATAGLGSVPQGPEDELLALELRGRIEAAIEALPARYREVLTLRDVEGWSAAEVCELLEVSEANQRVLLHRARVRVRDAMLPYLDTREEELPLALPASHPT